MYQKCLLLIQCRIVGDSNLLRKKWNNLLRTKPLQLSNRLKVLLVDAEISGHCNIHLLVSTYTRMSVIIKVQNVSMDV